MNSKLSLLDAIKAVLSDDLLKPQYRCLTNKHITTGHCYAASEALYHIFGGSLNWIPVCGRDETGTHWWLKVVTQMKYSILQANSLLSLVKNHHTRIVDLADS